ncbi:MAG: NUDIX domain-containing protein [Bacteroidales bacterium]|nr:NUDIX domain-containing protein [Bacteroidales bacterium]MCK9499474.1 NUDIX domain-containing protein [Bacteroidales bacterium]
MKKTEILKMILPGLLPLLVFILADEIWGTTIGLYVAISVGLVQLMVIYIKEKKLDKFVLFDTILILLMGAVSIILENDIFFKLKPGIIGLILILFLGISAFSPKNLLLSMSAHYFKGFEINKEQEKLFRRNIKTMFYLFAAHTLLVFYSAFFMSKQAWAFISGGLFYILFAVFFIVELLKNIILRRKFKKEELLSEIDAEGKLIGVMTRTEAHDGSKRMHPVIHVHILNSKGELLLQKRNKNKFIQPGKWDTAVGGHISHGEKIEIALERETYEELGLRNLKYQYITKYIWESEIEKEMVFVFLAQHEEFDFIKNNEVDEVKFWSFKQIKNNLSKNIFTPNFEIDFVNILSKIKK